MYSKQLAMKRHSYYRIPGIIFLTGLIFISGCETKRVFDPGYLEGTISIGPICPVERDPPDPGCLPTAETYNAYPVSIWTPDGRFKIAQIKPALNGTYSLELPAGNYRVILENKQFGIGKSNLPVEISISPKENTTLNINIDTGIR